jgi:hypothetical protein
MSVIFSSFNCAARVVFVRVALFLTPVAVRETVVFFALFRGSMDRDVSVFRDTVVIRGFTELTETCVDRGFTVWRDTAVPLDKDVD